MTGVQTCALPIYEPTNHLDIVSIEWLEDALLAFPGSVLLVGALGGCGDDGSSGAAEPASTDSTGGSESPSESAGESASPSVAPAVLATTYVSTEVTGYDLVADSQIRLTFEDGNLSVNAGCNTMFAPYELTEDSLIWTEIGRASCRERV